LIGGAKEELTGTGVAEATCPHMDIEKTSQLVHLRRGKGKWLEMFINQQKLDLFFLLHS
jgi:hypothetical protein